MFSSHFPTKEAHEAWLKEIEEWAFRTIADFDYITPQVLGERFLLYRVFNRKGIFGLMIDGYEPPPRELYPLKSTEMLFRVLEELATRSEAIYVHLHCTDGAFMEFETAWKLQPNLSVAGLYRMISNPAPEGGNNCLFFVYDDRKSAIVFQHGWLSTEKVGAVEWGFEITFHGRDERLVELCDLLDNPPPLPEWRMAYVR